MTMLLRRMLILLFLGTVVPPSVAQITAEPCDAEPSQPTTTYEFQIIHGTTIGVCATSNSSLRGWIFQPAGSDAGGDFIVTTVNGPALSFCVHENHELVVTVPSDPSTGSFNVVFTSQSGDRVTLSVSYAPRGFYRGEVLETDLRAPSSEPLWRAFGISVLDSKVCRCVGSNGLEEVSFLSPDPQLIATTTCLHGEPPNPSLISLLITGNVPSELIEESLSIVLVTGSCQMPDIESDPITIKILNMAISPSSSPSSSPSPSPSPLPTTSPSPAPSSSPSPTDSLPGPDESSTAITVGVVLGVLVLAVIIFIFLGVVVLVWRTPRCGRLRHNIENPPPCKANVYHHSHRLVAPVSGGESMELTLSTSELESTADSGGELQETDSGVGSGMPGTPKKSITVLTEDRNEWYQELKCTLAKLHQLQTREMIQPGQDVDFNAYTLDIGHALTDPLLERLYVVWEGSLESKRNRQADPFKLPLLKIVDCLESRSNETEKVVFVQLGSSSRTLSDNSIKTICMEEPASTTGFSGRMCAQKIFQDVQQLVAVDTDEEVSKSVSALPDRVITAEMHQQATSSWPCSRRPQPKSAATKPEGESDDRLWGILSHLSTAVGQIAHNTSSLGDIAHNTDRIADTSGQIADNTRQTAGSARQTADNTGQTASSTRQIADSIGQVASNTGQLVEEARVTRVLVEETRDLTEETNDTLQGCVIGEDCPSTTTS